MQWRIFTGAEVDEPWRTPYLGALNKGADGKVSRSQRKRRDYAQGSRHSARNSITEHAAKPEVLLRNNVFLRVPVTVQELCGAQQLAFISRL